MAETFEYALMSGNAYVANRHPNNWIPHPEDWEDLTSQGGYTYDSTTGFEAVAYRKGDEIVIAFAGTDQWKDWLTNFGAFSGAWVPEPLKQAAAFYARIRQQYGETVSYSFTGHSLGGGLASLMGVLFDEGAVTFDQAPFRMSANNDTRTAIRNYLAEPLVGLLSQNLADALDSFWSSQPANGEGASETQGIRGEGNVSVFSVAGEALLSVSPGNRIGVIQEIIPHAGMEADSVDLHSIALLAAIKLSSEFETAVGELPNLIPLIFDKNLYAFDTGTDSSGTNFMEHLVRQQVGIGAPSANKLLDKFSTDMSRLIATGGRTESEEPLNKALIAFAIQAYYLGGESYAGDFFESAGSGLKFDIDEVAGSLGDNKGYMQYFQSWFWPQVGGDNARLTYGTQLANADDWYIAGDRLVADAGQDGRRAFMLGAGQADSLTGGTQADLLVGLSGGDRLIGNGGADTLVGGSGTDFHFGGAGQDRYVFDTGDGEDLIIDGNGDGHGGDGQGQIEIDGQALAGSFALKPGSRTQWQKDGWTATFLGAPGERGLLLLTKEGRSDKVIVPHYQNGELGITLEAPPEIAYTDRVGTDDADNTALVNREHNASLETTAAHQNAFGMGGADLIELKHADTLGYGGANNDVLRDSAGSQELHGEDGNDLLVAAAGDDRLFGGIGDDVLQGGADNDRLDGGDGMDFIDGGQGSDYILGGSGDDFILGGGNLTLELSAVGAQYNDFADGQIAMLTKNAGGQFVLPDLAGVSPTDARAYEAGWVNVEGDAADLIDAGDGDDLVLAGDGTDVVKGDVGKDTLIGQAGGDWIEGGTEDDILLGDGMPGDVVLVESGNPLPVTTLPASHGDDYLDGGAGNDYLRGDGGSDILVGGADDDTLTGDAEGLDVAFHGDDILDGGTGNDLLYGYGGADTLIGGDDDDHLEGDSSTIPLASHGDDILDGGAGNDVLIGSGGNDILIGGSGIDVLAGGTGKDTYIFNKGDGVDIVADNDTGADASVFIFGAGIDPAAIELGKGSLLLNLGDGDAIHVENFDPDDPLANPGVEEFRFADGTSLRWDQLLARGFDLRGTAGDDEITGTALTDRFYGGTGNDTLAGGAGDDTYLYNAGDGWDTIIDAVGHNEIALGDGLDQAALTVSQSMGLDGARYLDLDFGNGDMISIEDGETGGIASLRFADGSTLGHAELIQRLPYLDRSGTDGDDTLSGTAGDDRLLGRDGDDVLDGGAGDDILEGGNGNDTLRGGEGVDLLDGGAGDDVLEGGTGLDTYRFGPGMGHDTVADDGGILELGIGIAPAALAHARTGDDLVIRLRDGTGGITLAGYFLGGQDWQVHTPDGATRPLGDFLAALDAGPADVAGARADYQSTVLAAWQARWHQPGDALGADGSVTRTYMQAQGDNPYYIAYSYRTEFEAIEANGGVFDEILASTQNMTTTAVLQNFMTASRSDRIGMGSAGSSSPVFIPVGNWVSRSGPDGYASDPIIARDENGAVTGSWHYPPGHPPPDNGVSSMWVDRVDTVYEHVVRVPEIAGTDDYDAITIHGRGSVDGGAGNDWLRAFGHDGQLDPDGSRDLPGAFLYGNDGDDWIVGGDDDDVLIGGRGNDDLDGGHGADTYRVLEEDGVDSISDAGDDFARYRQAWYRSLGILDIPFHEEFGGLWAVNFDGNWVGYDSHEAAVSGYLEAGWSLSVAEMEANGWLKYVAPLPDLPHVAGNDFAAVETLAAAGQVRADRVVFGPGVSADDIEISGGAEHGELLLTQPDGTGVRIALPAADDPVGAGIERVEFVDGASLSMAELVARANVAHDLAGGDGDDTFMTGAGDDVLRGGGGYDALYGGDGDDLLIGGAGDDWLDGGNGADTYRFEDEDGRDRIDDSGTDSKAYEEWYWASLGIDNIAERKVYGDRWIVDEGPQVFAFETEAKARGWAGHRGFDPDALTAEGRLRHVAALPEAPSVAANDFAAVEQLIAAGALRADRIVLGEGVTADNLAVMGTLQDGYLLLRQEDGTHIEANIANADSALGTGIERVEFADGSFLTTEDLAARIVADHDLNGGDGDDIFFLDGGNDVVRAGAGNDTLNGGGGDDMLAGGEGDDALEGVTGDDTLDGGAGSDSYYFERGYGHDTIIETTAGDDHNSIWMGFGEGTIESMAALRFVRDGQDLVMTVEGWEGDSLTLAGWFDAAAPARIQEIVVAVWDEANGYETVSLDTAAIEALIEDDGPPTLTAENRTLLLGTQVAATDLVQISGNVQRYEFWDDVNGGGGFVLDGIDQPAGTSIAVTADQVAGLQYVAGSETGSERVWARVSDGTTWSAWTPWTITSAPHLTNEAPVVSATDGTVGLNAAVAAAALFSVSDADGDVPTKYEFWDDGQGGGRFVLDGVDQAAGTRIAVNAGQLASLDYVGAGAMGSERVWARAWDGQAWSAWKAWNMLSSDHATNAAPVTQAANVTLLLGESTAVANLFTATDPDGDPIVKYEFWDDVDGGGRFVKGGIAQAAGTAIAVAADELAGVAYAAGGETGTERVWVRASDGVAWGAWTPWNITSAPHLTNAAPTVAASTGTAGLGQAVAVSTLFTVSDPDGDVPTKYEFWDDVGGGGYFAKSGVLQAAGSTIAVTATELGDFTYVGGDAMATERVWARAWDGQAWSAWTAWNMQSSNHATNAAPTVTAANGGVLAGDALAAATLFAAVDPDGDPVVKYEFWDDVNGGGHFAKGGVAQAAGASIAVAAAELADFAYVGGAAAATERVWVRASDGLAWSGWKAWNMTTVTGMQRGGPGGDSLIAHGEVLLGNDGNDSLAGPDGNNLLFGGAGDDTLSSGPGNNFLAGGTGNDTLSTGAGNDVIAFNAGDGNDTIYLNGGADTISLGGGIRYEDLALRQDGDDLVLATGNGESLTFKDWYADASHRSALNLQLIAETLADFDAGGGDPLRDDKVEGFDFALLVERFEQVRAENAAITQWHLMSDLLDAHLFGADDAALGGDLAYQYGRYGNFANVGLVGAQNVLNGSQFAIGPQSFQSLQGLQEGVARLG